MVNRLQELAEEARIKPIGDSWTYRVFDEFEEEYGRLIVQECLKILKNSEGDLGMAIWKIKRDFGVEE